MSLQSTHLFLEELEDRTAPAVFSVTTSADSGCGSFRQALINSNDTSGGNEILFAIPQETIILDSPLPAITNSVYINAEPASSALTALYGGYTGQGADGLLIEANYCTVVGLCIEGFNDAGIELDGASGCVIENNYIGTNNLGTSAVGNGLGVQIEGGGSDNHIGSYFNQNGFTSANIIAGNAYDGVQIIGSATTGNVVDGNYIGVSAYSGISGLGNGYSGVAIFDGAQNNVIGTSDSVGSGNLISGGKGAGVFIGGAGTNNNIVGGNLIGTDSTGTYANPNATYGVWITDGAQGNRIGVDADYYNTAPERNIISGNAGIGVYVSGSGTSGNLVVGNYIGTNSSGTAAVPNGTGVRIDDGATGNLIGTDIATVGSYNVNVISGNTTFGVIIAGASTDANWIAGNYIGTTVTGESALGNGNDGIQLYDGPENNIIGIEGETTTLNAEERNIISGNGWNGVNIQGLGTSENVVAGNYIGTDAMGTQALGNTLRGVTIFAQASDNRIGVDGNDADAATEGNVISGNASDGVLISDSGTDDNIVAGNEIGVNARGSAALGNEQRGVAIANGAEDDRIGMVETDADPSAERNIISGNGTDGVQIVDQGTTGNVVAGNYIGTDATGTIRIGNGYSGVAIFDGAQNNLIGTNGDGIGDASKANVISGGLGAGVFIGNTGTENNIVAGNFIGTDPTGNFAVPNALYGVWIEGGSQNNSIGVNPQDIDPGAGRNVISGNTDAGVLVTDYGTNYNQVEGNYIGTNVSGTLALHNDIGVLIQNEAENNTIGGNAAGTGNIISGNVGDGLELTGAGTTGNVIQGNVIGNNVNGTGLANTTTGVFITLNASSNTIGGSTATNGNVIANNGGTGVTVDSGNENEILSNSIYGNVGGGIYLNQSNDANLSQPAPQFTVAITATGIQAAGYVSNEPGYSVVLQFFANFGGSQGQTYLGTGAITLDPIGDFSLTLNALPPVGQYTITATATAGNNTSQFSVGTPLAASTLTITTASLPAWTVNQPYNQVINVSGGELPYQYAVTTSNLPAGLSLNAMTGAITGTPTTSTLTDLTSFTSTTPANPRADVIEDANGDLFGTTEYGGTANDGTIYEIPPRTNTPITLACFNGTNGANPYGGLVEDRNGNFFGTTYAGGVYGDGIVFELAAGSDVLTTLLSFNGTNGANPYSGLVQDNNGDLYGTTYAGGAAGDGILFELAAGNRVFTTLASFSGANGAHPIGGLVEDENGNLYGTTTSGGSTGLGTVFEIAAGSPTITTLVSFTFSNGDYCEGGLTVDSSGDIFGTTYYGGSLYYGTVFEIAAGSHTLSIVADFNNEIGYDPLGNLVVDSSGNLFGTTFFGGSSNEGTVFEVANGTHALTTLVTFNNSNGAYPEGGLVKDSSGNLIGTTIAGGPSGFGSVFEISAIAHTFSPLVDFNSPYPNGDAPGDLLKDSSGNLFGETSQGGVYGDGTVFEIAAGTHTVTTLVSFNYVDGADPQGNLAEDSSGNLYGTTYYGGTSGDGTVFELSAGTGTLTTLVNFYGANGANPRGGVVMDSSGNLYGTTSAGGSGYGTVFEISTRNRILTTLVGFNDTDGDLLLSGLLIDKYGNLFGTTVYGGTSGDGTVFFIPNGTDSLFTLVNFNSANGSHPESNLIQDSSGNLYGTTYSGGSFNEGTLFEISAITGTLTTLVAFESSTGTYPLSAPVIDSTGDLFGTTTSGGLYGDGTVFELPANRRSLLTLFTFNGSNGADPWDLLETNNGTFVGVANSGGPLNIGTVFILSPSTFTITVVDAAGASASQNYSIMINPQPAITTNTLPYGTVNQFYSQAIAVSGGTGPITYSLAAGNLPTGLTFNTSMGVISGTPTTATDSPFSLTINATDITGALTSENYNLVINPIPTMRVDTANVADASTTITINGVGFATTPTSNSVAFNLGVEGTITAASASQLMVTLTTPPTALGSLTVVVTVDGVNSGSPVQVATEVSGTWIVNNPSGGAGSLSAVTSAYAIAHALSGDQIIFATTLASDGPNPSLIGNGLTFEVYVSSLAPINNVSVSIEDVANGGAILATPTLTNGTVTFTLASLSTGTHNLIAVYVPFGTNASSQSNQVTETVQSTFGVNGVTATPSGAVVSFNAPIDPTTTVLYSSPGSTTLGAADVTLIGVTTGVVRGSLVIDPTNLNVATFLATSGLLAPDTYTLRVTSSVKAIGGGALSGNYSSTFTVASTTSPVLSMPNFARGPGQSVALSNTNGIPVDISNATDVTQASFMLTYDPTLLTIAPTGALSVSSAAMTAGLTTLSYGINSVDAYHSILTVSLSGGTGLTASAAETLLTILANVPDTAPYLNKALLNLSNVAVNGTTATGVSGVDEAAYLGNVSGSGSVGALDASLVNQVGAGSGTGFSAFKDLDPAIIGAVSGDNTVSALDASLINQTGAGASIAQIPSVPNGITPTFGGPDPYLYLREVQGSAGQTLTETLYLNVTDPQGIQLTALDEAIGFDAGVLQVSNVRSAAGLAGIGPYATASTVDNGSGVLLVGQAFAGSGLPPMVPYGTDIPVLQFNVTLNTDVAVRSETGLTLLQYGTVNGQTKYTAVSDNEGALTWTPGMAPSNSGNAAIDGSVTVIPAAAPVVPEPVVPATQRPVVVRPKVVESVRKVMPGSPLITVPSTAASQTVGNAATSDTDISPVPSLVSDAATAQTTVDETVVSSVIPLPSAVAAVQPGTAIVNIAATVAPAEMVSVASTAPSLSRAGDSGASLSLVAQGINKAVSAGSTGTSNAKPSTSALDEMYRQFGTLLGVPLVNGNNLGVGSDGTTEELSDVWDMEYFLLDQDFGRKSEELVGD